MTSVQSVIVAPTGIRIIPYALRKAGKYCQTCLVPCVIIEIEAVGNDVKVGARIEIKGVWLERGYHAVGTGKTEPHQQRSSIVLPDVSGLEQTQLIVA
jgi:hypothetical protein